MSKPTVSHETALKLAEAGFAPPEVVYIWQLYWASGDLCLVRIARISGEIEMERPLSKNISYTTEQFKRLAIFAPTALDIMAQMPDGTRLVRTNQSWVCVWDLDKVGAYVDNREDPCPHEAAAKAFLAWKAGLV